MKILTIIVAATLAACGITESDVEQKLCTQEDIDNGLCTPSYSWAQIQSYASQQPYNYAAINYPDTTPSDGGCRSTDGALTCHAHVGIPGTNVRWFVICDLIYTVEYLPGNPPQVVYHVHSVNCRAQRD